MQRYIIFILVTLFFASCKKDWLDKKPSKSLVVPSTIEDYQALLDNTQNGPTFNYNQPELGELCADDYYILTSTWQNLATLTEKNNYLWVEDGNYDNQLASDWSEPYNQILHSNLTIEGIEKVAKTDNNKDAWNNVKGSALFFRAFNFFNLAQLFCKPYIKSSADQDLGIPLRSSSDINDKSTRASVKKTYDQIIQDLAQANSLLPQTPLYVTRPSKVAAFGLLARVYLAMQEYDSAAKYSNLCLQFKNDVLDYNTLSATSTRPFSPSSNKEIVFLSRCLVYGTLVFNKMIVDTLLYQSYDNNDLRKGLFFRNFGGLQRFKGSYDGSNALFGGLATDEMYFIRAECYARKGDVPNALADLNTVLIKRWKTNLFIPFTASSPVSALTLILTERRKELCFRSLRWTDLRRLNQDTRFARTIKRIINGQEYSLPANDPRYVLPIPNREIQLSGIQQNPR